MYYNPNYGGGGWPMQQSYWPSYNYAAPQMYDNMPTQAAPQAPATGAQRDGMGWRAVRRQTRPLVEQQQAMLAPLQNRMAALQARGGTHGPKMQQRMDALQGRIDTAQGNIHDLNNMWRTGRRQSRNGYDRNAPATPESGAPGAAGTPHTWYEAGRFNGTPFGDLVQSNSGNGNLYKQLNGSDTRQFYYDPNARSWNEANAQQLANGQFANPFDYAAQAGAVQSKLQQKNGMWQVMPGYGTYA